MNTHEEQDDERLKPILNEIRKAGAPYSDEPDPRYWANFRVRVMERVEQAEAAHRPVGQRIWEWITERPLRSGLIGFSTAALVIVSVLMNPFTNGKRDVAVLQQPPIVLHHDSASSGTVPVTPIAPSHVSPSDVQVQKDMAATNKAVKKMLRSHEYTQHLRHSVESSEQTKMAELEPAESVSTVTTADSDLPVSLNDLSESQLESVLHSLESTK